MDSSELISYIILFLGVVYIAYNYFGSSQVTKKVVKKTETIDKHKVKPKRYTPGDPLVYFTAEEVAIHNKEDDLWLIIDGKVYNVTEYVDKHMGGLAIMRNAGKDSSEGFRNQHPDKVRQILDEFYMGVLQK
eukprot:gene7902-9723_t